MDACTIFDRLYLIFHPVTHPTPPPYNTSVNPLPTRCHTRTPGKPRHPAPAPLRPNSAQQGATQLRNLPIDRTILKPSTLAKIDKINQNLTNALTQQMGANGMSVIVDGVVYEIKVQLMQTATPTPTGATLHELHDNK